MRVSFIIVFAFLYWTPYRGIEMLICFPWKGSGGGVVYGCGVWRVKSWVKNVPDTNKYIAIFLIKWGWSRLTYLPLVVIIFEKSIILFYWTPYRGIDTRNNGQNPYWNEMQTIEPLIGGLRRVCRWVPYQKFPIEPLIGGLIRDEFGIGMSCSYSFYWTPYRGIDTLAVILCIVEHELLLLNPL